MKSLATLGTRLRTLVLLWFAVEYSRHSTDYGEYSTGLAAATVHGRNNGMISCG